MPTVDIWQRGVIPEARVSVPSAGTSLAEVFGKGLQELGAAGMSAASNVARAEAIEQKRQEDRDRDAALEGVQRFGMNYDAGFAELQKNAEPGAPGFTAKALADFDKGSEALIAKVPESQKAFARSQILRLRTGTQANAINFEVGSKRALDKQRSGELIGTAASWVATNPERRDFARDQLVEKIKALDLDPQEEAETLADVDGALDTAALGAFVQRNPRGALAAIDAGKYGTVPSEKLLQLRGQSESMIRAQEAEARQEVRIRQAEERGTVGALLDQVVPALQTTGVMPVDPKTGQPLLTKQRILSAFDGPAGEALLRKVETAQAEGQDRLSILDTNLADDYVKRDSLAAKPGEPWTDEQQHRYQTFSAAVDAKEKLLREDPAAAVLGSPALRNVWTTQQSLASTPGADPKLVQQATATAVNATMQAQIDLGAAPWEAKPLTKAQATDIAGKMRTSGPDGLKALAQEVVSYGPQAVAQVIAAGAPSGFAAITAIDDPVLVDQFAQAMRRPAEETAKILQSTGISRDKVESAVQTRLAPLFGTMSGESRALYQRAFSDLAIDALGRGAAGEDAAADAVTKSLLAGYNVAGKLRVPSDLDLDQVKAGLTQSMSDLLDGKAGIDVIPPPGFDGLGALREAARHGGLTWFMNEAGDGAVLATPEGRWIPIVTRTSRDKATTGRFEVKFSDAARIGVTVPPAPAGWGERRP